MVASGTAVRRSVAPGWPLWPPVLLPECSRRLLTRGGFFSPSLDGGLPLLPLFSPRRRSRSASRPISADFSARSNAFSACNASITASPLVVAVPSSRERVSPGAAIDTLTRTRPCPVNGPHQGRDLGRYTLLKFRQGGVREYRRRLLRLRWFEQEVSHVSSLDIEHMMNEVAQHIWPRVRRDRQPFFGVANWVGWKFGLDERRALRKLLIDMLRLLSTKKRLKLDSQLLCA